MTLGRCPLSIFCSRGTPPGAHASVDVMDEHFVEPTDPESIISTKKINGRVSGGDMGPDTHGQFPVRGAIPQLMD